MPAPSATPCRLDVELARRLHLRLLDTLALGHVVTATVVRYVSGAATRMKQFIDAGHEA